MTSSSRGTGLQTIFSIFLGLMVVAFVGVGTYTFYPPPQKELDRQIEELNRREMTLRNTNPGSEDAKIDRETYQEINEERAALTDARRSVREKWGRITSIILISFATLVMAVSLIRSEQLPVISNGLLMGGVFSMLYGVGWIVATDSSVARFVVLTAALVITLGLGYRRFVQARSTPGPHGAQRPEGGLAEIDQRVRELEARMEEAANALGHRGGPQQKD